MIYRAVEHAHPWIDYLGSVVLLITGFRLLLHDEQLLGLIPLLLGLALALARIARFKASPGPGRTNHERVPQAQVNDDGSLT